MTNEEHRARHIQLHEALDELLADWAAQQPPDGKKMYSNTTIMEFMQWSYEQTHSIASIVPHTGEATLRGAPTNSTITDESGGQQ